MCLYPQWSWFPGPWQSSACLPRPIIWEGGTFTCRTWMKPLPFSVSHRDSQQEAEASRRPAFLQQHLLTEMEPGRDRPCAESRHAHRVAQDRTILPKDQSRQTYGIKGQTQASYLCKSVLRAQGHDHSLTSCPWQLHHRGRVEWLPVKPKRGLHHPALHRKVC